MDILVKGATVVDPSSPFHLQTTDLFIQNGFIAETGSLSRSADRRVEAAGLHLCPGFADVFAQFCDPGLETRETLKTGALAAAAGGYTDVLLVPNTVPTVHDKAGVEYLIRQSASLPVNLHPIGAATKNAEGKELAEMYDMAASGAVAFGDGLCGLQPPGIVLKTLQYLKAIDKTLVQLPDDRSLSAHGLMNEGLVSTQLGLPGQPAVGEELLIARDIELLRYTGSRLHITGLSTAKGLALVRNAKAEGLRLSCSVSPNHLFFTEKDLADYDTNFKLTPPLRTAADREALRNGLLDGTVDCIASHHLPQHSDHKNVEFEYAKPGTISLETCFAAVRTAVPGLSLQRLVELFSLNPRRIFGLPTATIATDAKASLTLFLPDAQWTPDRFVSKSKNSPFTGRTITGLPLGIIQQDQLFLRP